MLRVKLKGMLLVTMTALLLAASNMQPVLAWSDLGGAAAELQYDLVSPRRGLGLGVQWEEDSLTLYIKESDAKAGLPKASYGKAELTSNKLIADEVGYEYANWRIEVEVLSVPSGGGLWFRPDPEESGLSNGGGRDLTTAFTAAFLLAKGALETIGKVVSVVCLVFQLSPSCSGDYATWIYATWNPTGASQVALF